MVLRKIRPYLGSIRDLRVTRARVNELEAATRDVKKSLSVEAGAKGMVSRLEEKIAEQAKRTSALNSRLEKVSRYINEAVYKPLSSATTPQTGSYNEAASVKVLIADDFHINPRNFSSLYEKLGQKSVSYTVGVPSKSVAGAMMKASGVYSEFADELRDAYRVIADMSCNDLFELRYKNVPVSQMAADEALSAVIHKPHWQDLELSKDPRLIFDRLWDNDRDVIRAACAACIFWTDYWTSLKELGGYDAVVVFSGSFIYGRTLLHLARYTKSRCFVIESFATGSDFFFEQRNSPIPNNSRIRQPHYRSRYLPMRDNPDQWERNKIRAFNKMRSMKNKNVQQPLAAGLPKKLAGKKVCLVLGQVVNDFSIISGCGSVLNTIPTYKSVISELLENSDMMVVFKAHPWESKKKTIGYPLTERALNDWADTLPDQQRSRLLIVSDWNLQQLLQISSYVVTLCSQSGIEAAISGLKPVVIGGAFYDSAGFTSNFSSALEAANAIAEGKIEGLLSLDEYSRLEEFLCVLLQGHLCNIDASGVRKITDAFRKYLPQKHVKSHVSELSVMPTWAQR